MQGKTVTRADINEAVYREIGLSRREVSQIVETVLDEIADALVSGQAVKISSFGSFVVRHKKERVGRNPKTGVEVPIASRHVLTFRVSDVLKDKVNRG